MIKKEKLLNVPMSFLLILQFFLVRAMGLLKVVTINLLDFLILILKTLIYMYS